MNISVVIPLLNEKESLRELTDSLIDVMKSYNFSYDRDLDFSNYDAITAKIGSNNFVSTFDYITENHEFGNSEIIKNNT